MHEQLEHGTENGPDREKQKTTACASMCITICEYGFYKDNRQSEKRTCVTSMTFTKHTVLYAVEWNLRSMPSLLRNSVFRVLQDETLHPYYLQRVQTLLPADLPTYACFALCFISQCAQVANFPSYVLFLDFRGT